MITSLSNLKTNTASKFNIVSKEPEWKLLCKECSAAAKKAGWTKKDSRNLLKEIREKNNF